MSATLPLLSGLPPPAWSDPALGAVRPAATPVAGGVDWFGPSASARTLSVQHDAPAHGTVEAWAQALVDHLLEPTR